MTAYPADAGEFSRPVDVRQTEGKHMSLAASEAECAALSARFSLVRIDRLQAELTLYRKDRTVEAQGRLVADFVQSCAVSAEDLPVSLDEALSLRFVPAAAHHEPEIEIEFADDEPDEIEYSGSHIDVGEAVAQSLALLIDPFLTGPEADAARARLRDPGASPFDALAALRKPD